jgi:heme-degrading monooxygenase HmoA
MILQIAQIRVRPGSGEAFQAAVATAADSIFARAKGFVALQLKPSLETEDKFWLLAHWSTLENHTVDFRGSPDFEAWRALAGPFFAEQPLIEHVSLGE